MNVKLGKHVAGRLLASVTLAILACSSSMAITRKELVSYASSLKGLKKAELKTALQKLLYPKQVLSYSSGYRHTWWGFWYTDRDEQTNECINRYSSKKFYFTSNNTGKAIPGMNIEHSFPKSWWGGSKNSAYQDLYNLYPSDINGNSAKGNYPMGIVTKVKTEDKGYDKVGTGTINGKVQQCWEPGDVYKGDFARGYMYMAVAYGKLSWSGTGLQTMTNESYPGLKQWASSLYCEWSDADKVDELERTRNDAVAKIQGNRNLLVDFPYLCEYLWGDSVNVAFNPYTSVTTATDDYRYMGVPSGIETVAAPVTPRDMMIYNLQGRAMGYSLKGLPKGVYVRRGRKFVVRH